jgi:hypothetical protein
MADIIDFQLLTAFAAVLSSVLGIFLSLVARRKIKPVEADSKKHQEELKERRKRLEPFIALRIPLYYNDELLDTLYSQCQLKRSPMEIDTITRKIASDSSQRLDGKILSVEARQAESEEQTLKEIKNREMKYERILDWLFDNGKVIIGLEKPIIDKKKAVELEQMLEQWSLSIKDKKSIVSKISGWIEKGKLDREAVVNRFLLVKGDFFVKELSEERIHLVLKNSIEFHVNCSKENCTSTGKKTFAEGSSITISVFGYTLELSTKEPMLIIDPIVINRSLDSDKDKSALKGG